MLLCAPRNEAALYAQSFLMRGARPIWCPTHESEPLDDYSALDDALMRLAEFDALVLLSQTSIDAIAARWLQLGDGDPALVRLMLEASSVEVCAIGADARHFQATLGAPATVAPIEPTIAALATTLHDLGHAADGARLLVSAPRVVDAGGGGPPPRDAGLAAFEGALAAAGSSASVEPLQTHALTRTPRAQLEAELSMLRDGAIDAAVLGSAEEARAVVGGADWPAESSARPVLLALGDEVGAAALELDGEAEVVMLPRGAGEAAAEAAADALDEYFGAGRLLL